MQKELLRLMLLRLRKLLGDGDWEGEKAVEAETLEEDEMTEIDEAPGEAETDKIVAAEIHGAAEISKVETSERTVKKTFEAKKAKIVKTKKAEKLMVLHQRLRRPRRL